MWCMAAGDGRVLGDGVFLRVKVCTGVSMMRMGSGNGWGSKVHDGS